MKNHLSLSHRPKYNIVLLAIIAIVLALAGIYIVFKSHAATFNADINGDGVVDVRDLAILAANFRKTGQSFGQGDLNGDGTVDIQDFSILALDWSSGSSTTAVKPPIQGLVTEDASTPNAMETGNIGGIVAAAQWSDLESTQNGPINSKTTGNMTANAIDKAIAVAKAYNTANPQTPIYVKIRILAGIDAPDWAEHLKTVAEPNGFNPVFISDLQTPSAAGNIGPFWTPEYAAAYRTFQNQLAALYNDDPLVRDITVSQCMTVFAEPFQRIDVDSNGGWDALYNEGYNVTDDMNCLMTEADSYEAWTHTHVSYSFNSWNPWIPQSGGGYAQNPNGGDLGEMQQVMAHCRDVNVLGSRCTIENNSIRADTIGKETNPSTLYYYLAGAGNDITFQTASASRICGTGTYTPAEEEECFHTTVDWAATQVHANSVEVPQDYDQQEMQDDNQLLLANPIK